MLALALIIAAAPAAADAGVEVGAEAFVPAAAIAHAGVFGQLRLDALLLRVDVTGGVNPLAVAKLAGPDVQVFEASAAAAWVFEMPLQGMDMFVGGGPGVAAVRSTVDPLTVDDVLGTPNTVIDFVPLALAVAGCELHAGSSATFVAAVHGGLGLGPTPLVASIDGGAAFHF